MSLVKLFSFGLLFFGPPVWAVENYNSKLSEDFSTICVEQLPNIEKAIAQAKKRNFVALSEGVVPELDEVLRNEPEWDHFARTFRESSLVTLRLAERAIAVSEQETLGASSASLCEIGVINADIDQFSNSLTERLELDQPTMNIMNSGRRERSWNIYIAYNVSTIILKEIKGTEQTGFTVGLVVPHQIR